MDDGGRQDGEGHPGERRALVTGCAGFIGSHLCEALLARGDAVVGVDCFTDYYSREQKEANLATLRGKPRFELVDGDLNELPLPSLLEGVEVVYHLAAQPGVRLSFGEGFRAYLRDNVQATQCLLEAAAEANLMSFVYASSSSVYGEQEAYPVTEAAPLRPVSPYGATKVITEQLAGAFWRSAGVPVVGMRYFTVYGPRQRPDMAFSRFLASALAAEPLTVLGDGSQVREFTYVADIVAATLTAAERGERGAVYNVGGGDAVALRDVIELLGVLLGDRPALRHLEPAPGDPKRTHADISRAARDLGYLPSTPLVDGLAAQLAALRAPSRRRAARPGGARASRRPRGSLPPPAEAGPRVLAYSHDGYGLGHLRRNLRIVSALRRQRPDAQALIVTGALSAERLVEGRGVGCLPLPSVVKVGNGRYVDASGARSPAAVVRARAELIANAVSEFRPDLLLVDRYPRGMHDELAPAMELLAENRPRARAVLGLRDILDEAPAIRREWEAGGYTETILERYDAVLCYGDRRVYDPVREYSLPPEVAERLSFTGYLADELPAADAADARRRHAAPGERLAVCTLGGGRDAAPIAEAFLGAMQQLRANGWTAVLITGPYMSDADRQRLARHPASGWIPMPAMVDDVPSYLAAADAAVCMGGYNTTCELLALSVPAVIVPRVQPRREQLMRAERLGSRGLLRWLHPALLTPEMLAHMVGEVAERRPSELAGQLATVHRRGSDRAAAHLAALLPAARPARALKAEEQTRVAG